MVGSRAEGGGGVIRRALDVLLSKQGRKLGAWLLLLIGVAAFAFAAVARFFHSDYDLPSAAVGLFCFIWGAITGHSMWDKYASRGKADGGE